MSAVDQENIGYTVVAMRKESIADVLELAEKEGLSSWTYEDYEAEIVRDDSITLQAISVDSDELIGFMVMRLITIKGDDFPSNFNLLNIGVKNSFKNRRIGTSLLTAALQRISAYAPAEIWLEVRTGNLSAIAFYEKHGFTREGTRKNFYRHPEEDAIVMKLVM